MAGPAIRACRSRIPSQFVTNACRLTMLSGRMCKQGFVSSRMWIDARNEVCDAACAVRTGDPPERVAHARPPTGSGEQGDPAVRRTRARRNEQKIALRQRAQRLEIIADYCCWERGLLDG